MGILNYNQRRPSLKHPEYLDYVRALPCCGCGVHGQQQAHHNISGRYGSAKCSDFWTMPLCADCHRVLHAGWTAWEEAHGTQDRHCLETLEQALRDGVLVVDKRCARALS